MYRTECDRICEARPMKITRLRGPSAPSKAPIKSAGVEAPYTLLELGILLLLH
jgi:hypothetical protein